MTLQAPSKFPSGTVWVHRKSGNPYTLLHVGLLERSLDPMVIYTRADEIGGTVWIRPAVEFLDGRFTVLLE